MIRRATSWAGSRDRATGSDKEAGLDAPLGPRRGPALVSKNYHR
ncbi:hypothetical protein ABZW18_07595 [Streptomyces sp. NPDC004647]